MRLLLTSFLHPRLGTFFSGTVAYIPDAARTCRDAPFAVEERQRIARYGFDVVEVPVAGRPPADLDRILSRVDGIYVASGETFDLLHVLRSTGADEVVSRRVREGLPYAASSAGSIVAGPSIEPNSIMDSPAIAPGLTDYSGLGLVDRVIVPHAQGTLPPFPIGVIARTVEEYGVDWPLTLLRDGEALLVDEDGCRLV
jgi:dipeptidase E